MRNLISFEENGYFWVVLVTKIGEGGEVKI